MQVTRFAAVAGGTGLLALAALHAAWGWGRAWPFADRETLADAVIGAQDVPGPAACFAVGGALAAAGLLVAGRPASLPLLRRAGASCVAVVLAIRGVLGLAGRTAALSPESVSARFGRLDKRVYSPLCLALAALAVLSASRPAWTADDGSAPQQGPHVTAGRAISSRE